jgi:hypothetical protein
MLLRRKALEKYLLTRRINIPEQVKQDLLSQYGNLVIDDEGYPREYTEQDISEQLRINLEKYAPPKSQGFTLS